MVALGGEISTSGNCIQSSMRLINSQFKDLLYPESGNCVESLIFVIPATPECLSCALWFPNLVSLQAVGIGLGDGDLQIVVFPIGIEKIDFSDNLLTCISDWSAYKLLRDFRVDRNSVRCIANLKMPKCLTALSLEDNQVDVFPDLSNLRFLDSLNLSGNRVSSVPAHLIPTSLREFKIARNEIELFPEISSVFRRMEVLDLSANPISKNIESLIACMPNLIDLSVPIPHSPDERPNYLSLRHLRTFNSSQVNVEDKITACFSAIACPMYLQI